jgi:DNA-binding transcriptional LysR family regulator
VPPPGSGTRIAVEKFFEANGLTLKVAVEMNKNEAIKQAGEAGLCVGVVHCTASWRHGICAYWTCKGSRCCANGIWCSGNASC